MYWNRQALANSVNPDLMPQNVASDLDLHCLPLIQQFLDMPRAELWSNSKYWDILPPYHTFPNILYNSILKRDVGLKIA